MKIHSSCEIEYNRVVKKKNETCAVHTKVSCRCDVLFYSNTAVPDMMYSTGHLVCDVNNTTKKQGDKNVRLRFTLGKKFGSRYAEVSVEGTLSHEPKTQSGPFLITRSPVLYLVPYFLPPLPLAQTSHQTSKSASNKHFHVLDITSSSF